MLRIPRSVTAIISQKKLAGDTGNHPCSYLIYFDLESEAEMPALGLAAGQSQSAQTNIGRPEPACPFKND